MIFQLFQDGLRLVAGYEDGVVKIWDLKASAVLHSLPASSHDIRVTAVDSNPENSLVVSISTDGMFKLICQFNL